MKRHLVHTLPVLASTLLLAACVSSTDRRTALETAPTTVLDRDEVLLLDEMHFTAVGGANVIAAPGVYRVDTAPEGALSLSPGGGGKDLVVAAATSEYGEPVASPEATVVFGDELSEGHVVLLLPGGDSREAVAMPMACGRAPVDRQHWLQPKCGRSGARPPERR